MIISTSTDFCPRQPRPTLAEVPCRGFAPARVDGYFCYGIVPLPTRDTGFRATTKRLTFPTWGHGDAPHRPWCAFYSFFVYILLFCLAAVYTWYYTPRPQNIYTFETATVQQQPCFKLFPFVTATNRAFAFVYVGACECHPRTYTCIVHWSARCDAVPWGAVRAMRACFLLVPFVWNRHAPTNTHAVIP